MKPLADFHRNLNGLRAEFDLRLEGALDGVRCGLSSHSQQRLAEEAAQRGACPNTDEALTAISEARRVFVQWGVTWTDQEDCLTEVAEALARGALDALCSSDGSHSLPFSVADSTIDARLTWQQVPGGPMYCVQPQDRTAHELPREPRWLLLVNALGIPLTFWTSFFTQPSARYRLCVVDVQPGDLLRGGIYSDADLSLYADQYLAVLRHLGASDALVMGWSNGGRIALDIAARGREFVGDVVLLSPTLRGFAGHEEPPTTIEANLERAFRAVTQDEDLADALSAILYRSSVGALVKRPASSAEWAAFHALPPRAAAPLLAAPVRTGRSLLSYARRNLHDEAYPMHEVLARVTQPITLIQGDCDNVVSNAQASSCLRFARATVRHLWVTGAGHYVNALQPQYLWALLDAIATGQPLSSLPLPLRSRLS